MLCTMIWVLLAGALVLLIWYCFIRPLSYFTRMGVNQSKPWPVVGDMWVCLLRQKSFGEALESIYNLYPKSRYVGLYQFTTPILTLRDPELIKQLTVKDFDHFTDHTFMVDPKVDPLWHNNLFSLKGQKWREMRATVSGTFTSSKMKHIFGIINEAAENFTQYFLDKDDNLIELDMKDTYTRYTNDVIATSAFGIKVNSLADPENTFYNMGRQITDLNGFLTRIKFFIFFLAPRVFKLFKLGIFSREASLYFRNIIHETIRVREEKGTVRQDMINLLLEARRGNKVEEVEVPEAGFAVVKGSTEINKYKFKQLKKLTDDDITSQALIFFFAGFETISTCLCFGSYELATNKDVQDKLRDEIKETHKTHRGKLTYDILLKMKYIDMVLSEILRKWPPLVGIDRVCTKPYTIEPIYPDEKPVHLKVGDLIFLPIRGLHRDPNYYPEPEKFDPERFSNKNKDSINQYTFIPFGSGPRNCIGSRFAILEAKVLLYHLLLNFEIVPTERTIIPLKLAANTLQPSAEGGFWFGLQRIRS